MLTSAWLPMLVLLAGDASVGADLQARVDQAPGDVKAFIVRRAECNHFMGEEPYDEARRAYLDRALRELRCNLLHRDERRLRHVHRKDGAVLRLLDETAHSLGW